MAPVKPVSISTKIPYLSVLFGMFYSGERRYSQQVGTLSGSYKFFEGFRSIAKGITFKFQVTLSWQFLS